MPSNTSTTREKPPHLSDQSDLATYDPNFLGGEVCSKQAEEPPLLDVQPRPFFELNPVPILAWLVSPKFQVPPPLRNPDNLLRLARPLTTMTTKIGVGVSAFWTGIAALFGAGVGVISAGPGPAMVPVGDALDFSGERLQKLLKPEDLFVLTKHLTAYPEDKDLVLKALHEPTLQKQREKLYDVIRTIVVSPGETLRVVDSNGNPLFEYQVDPIQISTSENEVLANEGEGAGSCPPNMVYVSKVESRLSQALCVDEDDYPSLDNPSMPMVHVSVAKAESLCAARKARLPTAEEYYAVASYGGRKNYPTKDGSVKGIHYKSSGPRRLKWDPADNFLEYQQPDGSKRKIYNPTGNVWKILEDGKVGGGAWSFNYDRDVRADSRDHYYFVFGNDDVGFRCVTSPQDIK